MRSRDRVEPRCEYCRYGSSIGNDELACIKRGIVAPSYRCARFKYDASKRVPEARGSLDTSKYTTEDFKIS
ncbi:MAG: hypothetical protein LBT36_00900 [Oscillospiraceae bacterium]|jgi:hypothetical protein|nr:hypothetical protein [Oscillospiraceae bacterium]